MPINPYTSPGSKYTQVSLFEYGLFKKSRLLKFWPVERYR